LKQQQAQQQTSLVCIPPCEKKENQAPLNFKDPLGSLEFNAKNCFIKCLFEFFLMTFFPYEAIFIFAIFLFVSYKTILL
jgi:hypothetical protein